MAKTILVTGSSGFIAFHTISLLLKQGYTVVGIDEHNDSTCLLLKEQRLKILQSSEQYHFVLGSINNKVLLHQLFQKYQFFGIINLAARAGVRSSVINPDVYLETNEYGFLNLLNCAKTYGVKQIVQASTSSIYDGEQMPFLETSACNKPLSPYAASKKGAEGYAYVYQSLFDLNIAVMRFFTVYGPFGRPDMSIFRFIKWIYEDSPLQINGDGKQTRDFTYVGDIAQAIVLSLENVVGYEILNVGNNSTFSLAQMIEYIETYLGKQAIKQYHPKDPSDMLHTHANIDKIYEYLKWKPSVEFPDGLKVTVDWFLEGYESWIKDISID